MPSYRLRELRRCSVAQSTLEADAIGIVSPYDGPRNLDQEIRQYFQVTGKAGLDTYLEFFNRQRRHQSLEYATPWDVYRRKVKVAGPAPRM